ncbi:MAG: hypothetical protein NT011_07220 [Kiritimatiellaeota bacterium]|nr:hypothetical protein [Kiritimatiellota bacterium]
MKFIGKVIKREGYVDRKGQAKEKVTLLDEAPDGSVSVQFIDIPGDSTNAKKDEFVEFTGRIVSSQGAKSFVIPEAGSVKIIKVKG